MSEYPATEAGQRNPRLAAVLGLHAPGAGAKLATAVVLIERVVEQLRSRGYYLLVEPEAAPGAEVLLSDDLLSEYASLQELAAIIEVEQRTASRYDLPPADVVVGDRRGWRVSTVRRWHLNRRKNQAAFASELAALAELESAEVNEGRPAWSTPTWLYRFDQLRQT